MKRLTFLLALFCSALIAVVSCDKPGSDDPSPDDGPAGIPEEYGSFELAEGAVFMTEDMTSMFSSVEDGKIVIPSSVSQSSVPAEGTIIIAPITEKTPSGLLVRVVSVQETASGYVLTTEPVSLFDAFEELKVDTAIDISSYLEAVKDKDGSTTDFESITDDIWSQFIGEDSEETKSKATVTMPAATIGIPVEAAGFNGQLYTSFELTATVDISRVRQVNSFEFKVNRKTGISGGWSVEHEGEWEKKYLEKEFNFAPIHIPGTPLVLTPKLYAELAGSYEGKTEFMADVNYLFEDQTYTISCTKGNAPTFSSENSPVVNEKSFLFGHLTFDGTFSLSATAGGKICLYNENVLAVGGELGAEAVFSASAGVSMDDAGLLIQNPEVSFNINFGAALYCESLIFKLLPDNEDGRISKDFEFPLVGLTLHALPAYSDLELGSMRASGKFEKYSMIVWNEIGFALFEEDGNAALEHQPISGSTASKAQTKAVVELPKISGSVTFVTTPDPNEEYVIKPYVKAWGKYYYGPGGINKRLKRIFNSDDEELLHIKYDDENRPIWISFYNDRNFDISYTPSVITFIPKYDSFPLEYHFDDQGYMYKQVTWSDDPPKQSEEYYTYESGFLSTCYGRNYIWHNGDIVQASFVNGGCNISYSDTYFISNINWLFLLGLDDVYELPLLFPGTYPKHLPSSYNGWYYQWEEGRYQKIEYFYDFQYTFDEYGYVLSVIGGEDDDIIILEYEE